MLESIATGLFATYVLVAVFGHVLLIQALMPRRAQLRERPVD